MSCASSAGSSNELENAHIIPLTTYQSYSDDSSVIGLKILASYDEGKQLWGASIVDDRMQKPDSQLQSDKISVNHQPVDTFHDYISSVGTQSLRGLHFINSVDIDYESNSTLIKKQFNLEFNNLLPSERQRQRKIKERSERNQPITATHIKINSTISRIDEHAIKKRFNHHIPTEVKLFHRIPTEVQLFHHQIPTEVQFQTDRRDLRDEHGHKGTSRLRGKVPQEIKVNIKGKGLS